MTGSGIQGLQNHMCYEWIDRLLNMTKAIRSRDFTLYLGSGHTGNDMLIPMELADVDKIKHVFGTVGFAGRVYYQAVDYFIRLKVEPFQAVLNTWMRGAKARVDSRDIPFTEIITWCQETSDNRIRNTLAEEARSICALLIPFNYASWRALLNTLEHDLGYPEYMSFCEKKRGISLAESCSQAQDFLDQTRDTYIHLVEPWLKKVTGMSLKHASRFDAIYLLGLRYLDHLFPQSITMEKIAGFFRKWGIDLTDKSALHIHSKGIPGCQSYCIPVDIPGEIHIITGPLKGWLDMESLFHELGHALSFTYTDPALSPEEKDFFQSWSLSEAFAFLFQRMCMSREFLCKALGLSYVNAQTVARAHALKWLTLTRRYATKLVIEVENFRLGRLRRGQPFYSELMRRESGFYYDPETYLFDLMPDFYSLDYFHGFMGSACLSEYLTEVAGAEWMLNPETGNILRYWWQNGNRVDLASFINETLDSFLESSSFIKVNQYDLRS